MADRRVAVRAYRSLLKWARAHRDIPFAVRESDARLLVPEAADIGSLEDAASVVELTRLAFRYEAAVQVGLGRFLCDEQRGGVPSCQWTNVEAPN